MPDLFRLVRADHERLRSVLDELGDDDRLPPWRAAKRRKLVQRLVIESSRHEVAEEQILWPAVRERVPDGRELARQAMKDEQAAKRLLRALERTPVGGADHRRLLERAGGAIRQHAGHEEREVLPQLAEHLDAETTDVLGSMFGDARSHAPTRPHVHTPPVPGILRVAGRLVAPMDRTRDFLTRRG